MHDVQRINLDDYIQTGEGGTSVAYTHKNGKTLAKLYKPGFEADKAREEFLFHITHETFLAHWNIFFPAYLGTTDPQRIAEAEHRLAAFASAKIPYMYDLADQARLPEPAFQSLIKAFG